jgi:hypothetical protein
MGATCALLNETKEGLPLMSLAALPASLDLALKVADALFV